MFSTLFIILSYSKKVNLNFNFSKIRFAPYSIYLIISFSFENMICYLFHLKHKATFYLHCSFIIKRVIFCSRFYFHTPNFYYKGGLCSNKIWYYILSFKKISNFPDSYKLVHTFYLSLNVGDQS